MKKALILCLMLIVLLLVACSQSNVGGEAIKAAGAKAPLGAGAGCEKHSDCESDCCLAKTCADAYSCENHPIETAPPPFVE